MAAHGRRLRAVNAALSAGSDEPRPPGWPELRKSATPSRDHPLPPLGLSAEIEFHERGFIVVRKLIPEHMCERMMQGYQRAIEGGRDRKPNDPEGEPLLMQLGGRGRDGTGQPEWEGIPYLERIVAVGKQLMGDDMDFAYDQIIYKPPGTSVELLWHQDAGYGWPGQANARGMTSWLALSPATEAMARSTLSLEATRVESSSTLTALTGTQLAERSRLMCRRRRACWWSTKLVT